MKVQFFLSLFIFIFSCSSTLWGMDTAFPPRRLIILFDPHGQEIATSTDFAIMSGLISALEQQAAPIIISESLWNNFVIRRFRYDRLKDKHPTGPMIFMELLHKYGPILTGPDYLSNTRTIEKLHDLYAAHYGYYQQALQVIRTNKGFNRNMPLNGIKVFEPELQPDHPLRRDIDFDFVCYKTTFNPHEWTVHHIPNFAYILIPQAYEKQLAQNIKMATLPQLANITKRELILGLKVDHISKVADPLKVPDEVVSAQQAAATDKADLKYLFVTRGDLGLLAPERRLKAPESFENLLGPWNVYATGHGSPDKSASIKEQIAKKEKQLKQYEQEIQEMKQLIDQYNKDLALANRNLHLPSARAAKESSLRLIELHTSSKNAAELAAYQLRAELIDLYKGVTKGKIGGVIAGLYIDEFKEVLAFFNSSVRTGSFFYDTCFSSGKNLEAAYQYKDLPVTYNYTIVSGASVDAPTTVGGAKVAIPPYTGLAGTLFVQTQVRNGQEEFKIYVEQHFDTYFDQLEEFQAGSATNSFADILDTIHTFKTRMSLIKLHNVPLVRFPNTEWFRVVDMPKFVASITEQSVVTHQAENKPFKLTTQEAVLVSTPHVPVPVNVENDKMPAMLSMIGGNADHYFEEISAPKVSLSDVIAKFLAIPGQYFTKRYLIKKLTCRVDTNPQYKGLIAIAKGDKVTLRDVIIMQNDTEYFTDDPHNKVNVVLFTYTGIRGKDTLAHRAVWPASEKLNSGEIPNLEYLSETGKEAQKQLAKVAQAFAQKSQPPAERAEQLAGRTKIISFVKDTAKKVLQEYKKLKETNPQGIATWLKTLPANERKMITVIHESEIAKEMAKHKPTLTKKEFEAWKKAQQSPTTGTTAQPALPLTNALQQLERSLKNLQQRLR